MSLLNTAAGWYKSYLEMQILLLPTFLDFHNAPKQYLSCLRWTLIMCFLLCYIQDSWKAFYVIYCVCICFCVSMPVACMFACAIWVEYVCAGLHPPFPVLMSFVALHGSYSSQLWLKLLHARETPRSVHISSSKCLDYRHGPAVIVFMWVLKMQV